MKYKKLTNRSLLTSIYSDPAFRKEYFHWLIKTGEFPEYKRYINKIVVDYENYLLEQIEGNSYESIKFENIDLVDYPHHRSQIGQFIKHRKNSFKH